MLVAWGSLGSGSTAGLVEASADGIPSRARKGGAKSVRRWPLAAGSALWLPALTLSAGEEAAPSPARRSPTLAFGTRSFGIETSLLAPRAWNSVTLAERAAPGQA